MQYSYEQLHAQAEARDQVRTAQVLKLAQMFHASQCPHDAWLSAQESLIEEIES